MTGLSSGSGLSNAGGLSAKGQSITNTGFSSGGGLSFTGAGPIFFLAGRADVAMAYSFRHLNSTYLGPVIRARRASDNAELDFNPSTNALLTFAAINTWAGGNAFVVTLYDQSGNARDVTQATAALQPQIINGSNSNPAMLFDGVDDLMRSGAFAIAQPVTINTVFRLPTAAGAQVAVDNGTNETFEIWFTVGAARIYGGTTLSDASVDAAMPIGARAAFGGAFNGASSLIEVNSTSLGSAAGTAGTNGITTGITVGAAGDSALFINMEMQELIYFNTAHLSGQLAADNSAMRTAWNF